MTTADITRECTEGSVDGRLKFPQVVQKLTAAGFESYHMDLYRMEKTYYKPGGQSQIEAMPLRKTAIADQFSQPAVQDAILASQQGRISYVEFMRRIAEAGTTQYFVFLRGRRALYVGLGDGSQHVEHFPSAV